ncbi:MAG TPA: hypothetical protein PLW10_20195, partial [Myxococcota bacterium]|nr:hypothetical protein [Myxococcota bacterium]
MTAMLGRTISAYAMAMQGGRPFIPAELWTSSGQCRPERPGRSPCRVCIKREARRGTSIEATSETAARRQKLRTRHGDRPGRL